MHQPKTDKLKELEKKAYELGVSDAVIISAADIYIDDKFAKLCVNPRCENYGLSANCPPNTGGPSWFKSRLTNFDDALLFKIDVPSYILLSSDRIDVFKILHETAAKLEITAESMGFKDSQAYAGGSCKQLFCEKHPYCRVLKEKGDCRNPDKARPSMSGFGVDVKMLIKTAGWSMNWVIDQKSKDKETISSVCGLVLLGKDEK